MGTIIKRGQTYYIRFEADRKPDGSRWQVMKACPGMTYKQAQQALRDMESQVAQDEYLPETDQTVGAFLENWLQLISTSVAISTWTLYHLIVTCHLIPTLGHIKLSKLTPMRIQTAYKSLQNGPPPLAAKTVKNIHGVLHRALEQAVRWQLLKTNPAGAVNPPRVRRPDIQVASPQELAQLQEAVRGTEWHLPILIALSTGMRRGEICALQWQDFDPTAHLLLVRRALSRIRDTQIQVKDPKSGRARVVTINPSLVAALEQHRAHSPYTAPADWICARADGTALNPSTLTKAFTKIATRLGLSITFHSLRHSQATTLIAAGVPVKVVSERLGHASVGITQDIYTHVLPAMQQHAADVVEQLLFHNEHADQPGDVASG
jgi:integrase